MILECSPAIWDFSGLHHHVNAARGGNGASKSMIGTREKDKVTIYKFYKWQDFMMPPVVWQFI